MTSELNYHEGDVQANGVNLHYYRTGGDKPPLVLAHGFTDNGLCWARVAGALADEYNVVMVDARGHGKSARADVPYSSDDQADDLAGVIRALGLERPPVLGHSMGATTTALMAARHPDLPRCVLLEDPPWFLGVPPGADEPVENPWFTWLRTVHTLSYDDLYEGCKTDNPDWDEAEYGPWAESKQQFDVQVLDFVHNTMVHDWRRVVPQITCPLLLITGDAVKHGAIVTPEVAEAIREQARNGQVARIPNAGHSIHRDQFEPYMTVVRAFLRENR
jgi:pimeloyl-ACP methyl ester carboxylesterase